MAMGDVSGDNLEAMATLGCGDARRWSGKPVHAGPIFFFIFSPFLYLLPGGKVGGGYNG